MWRRIPTYSITCTPHALAPYINVFYIVNNLRNLRINQVNKENIKENIKDISIKNRTDINYNIFL